MKKPITSDFSYEAHPHRLPGLYKPYLGGGARGSQNNEVGRVSRKSAAFTLIEILLVVSIIGILAGAGLPSLGKALRVYRFKANANQVQAFLYLARNSAMSEVRAKENPDEVDTNFDGTTDDSDLLPFAYVFEIEHGASPNGNVTLKTYADFNTDEPVYFPDTDVLVKQKTFLPSELQITYEGLYDFESPATPLDLTPNGKTYSFSYDTITKQFSMVEYATSMSTQKIDLITIQMTNPDATRTNTINLFHLSGAPFVSG